MKKQLFILIYILGVNLYAQTPESEIDSILKNGYILKGEDYDSLVVDLGEVLILPKLKFKDAKERRHYYWMRRKVRNAYPYAKLATERYIALTSRLKKIKSKRRRKRYTKRVQKYLEKKFTDPLKKLTRTEGRVLIKLIHRQTGRSAYSIVKELRSGWKAYWYNVTAGMFDLDLKAKYNPLNVKEDFIIEDILQRSFNDEKLEYQDSKLLIDYFKIASKWK